MPETLFKKISEDDKRDLYELYCTLYRIKKCNSNLFSDIRLNAIFTNIMANSWWGWHVIGISHDAFQIYKSNNFRHPRGKLQRGHILMRINTVREYFNNNKPLTLDTLFKQFIKNDKTIIMTKEENRLKTPPKNFIKINNTHAKLFQNRHIGWKHGLEETEYLTNLSLTV